MKKESMCEIELKPSTFIHHWSFSYTARTNATLVMKCSLSAIAYPNSATDKSTRKTHPMSSFTVVFIFFSLAMLFRKTQNRFASYR